MKAIILTRVSTKMQEEGLSLLAQSNRLQDYADRKGLEVIKTFEIVESSTHGERKQFMEMINFCKKQREIRFITEKCEHSEDLCRMSINR